MADGWPDQTSTGSDPDNKDWNSPQDNAAFSDLVPEFEPGKPWKVKVIARRFRTHYPASSGRTEILIMFLCFVPGGADED